MQAEPLFWDVVEERRSIRKYKPDPVPAEMIERILQAGVSAPNARNRQSWRFVVVREAETIDRLADALNEKFIQDLLADGRPEAEVYQKAVDRKARICGGNVIVVLFVDVAVLDSYSPEDPNKKEYLMAVQSAALAGGQMLLAGQALDLGGLWMGGPLHAQRNMIDFFKLPETWLAQGLLLFGYPAEKPEKKARVPMEQVVKYFS